MNVGSSHTYKAKGLETTEWEDVLVRKGVIEERVDVVLERTKLQIKRENEQELVNRKVPVEDKLKDKSLEELDEVEDDFEDEFIQKFRQQRLADMKKQAKKDVFGRVYPIHKSDFVREVTDASKRGWVIVELFQKGIPESVAMSELLSGVAERQKSTKFVNIQSTECVENWPDDRVPCLFLYNAGKLQTQLIGLDHCGGKDALSVDKLEWSLASKGVFKSSCESDPFVQKFNVRRNFVETTEKGDERHSDDDDW